MVCSNPAVYTCEEFIRNLLSADVLFRSKRSPTFWIKSRNLHYFHEFQNLFVFRKVSGHQSIKITWVSYQHDKYATQFPSSEKSLKFEIVWFHWRNLRCVKGWDISHLLHRLIIYVLKFVEDGCCCVLRTTSSQPSNTTYTVYQ
jgi:hypothetical protein